MADKTLQLALEGLARAVAEPAGRPLHGNKNQPGLFATTGVARQAAQHCKDAGYLQVLRTETKGKTTAELCAITEKGIAYLVEQVSPKSVLEQFVRAVEARGQQVGELLNAVHKCRQTFDALQTQVAKVLAHVQPSATPGYAASVITSNGTRAVELPAATAVSSWKAEAVSHLAQWRDHRPNEDCPLPELYRQIIRSAAHLSVGQFHDGLRQLHDEGRIYLHPWTGPLYEVPEPAYAMLIGHAVSYYASLKS